MISQEYLSQRSMAVPCALVTWATSGSVAVAVGASVAVSVCGSEGIGVKTEAVNVNCETTVLAADVRTAATSGVGPGVVADPQATSRTVMIRIVAMSFGFIKSLFRSKQLTLIYNFDGNR